MPWNNRWSVEDSKAPKFWYRVLAMSLDPIPEGDWATIVFPTPVTARGLVQGTSEWGFMFAGEFTASHTKPPSPAPGA